MDETKTDNLINFPAGKSPETEPKTKESSVLDFTYLSLDELESQVVSLFPNEKNPEGYFHSYGFIRCLVFSFHS